MTAQHTHRETLSLSLSLLSHTDPNTFVSLSISVECRSSLCCVLWNKIIVFFFFKIVVVLFVSV